MSCAKCGYQGTRNDTFCYHCGGRLTPLQPEANPEAAKPEPPKSWRSGQVALGVFLVLVSAFAVVGISDRLGWIAGRFEEAVIVWEFSLLVGFAMLVVVWYLGLRPLGLGLASLGLIAPTTPRAKLFLMTAGTLGASLGATAIYGWITSQFDWDILAPPPIPEDIVFPGLGALLTFQALAIWTPLTEEIFFRGFVFAGLLPRLGVGRAMVVSALVFSGFHLWPGVLLPIFITGLLLAWLYHKTGSIWPCIAAHAGQNMLAVAVTSYGG